MGPTAARIWTACLSALLAVSAPVAAQRGGAAPNGTARDATARIVAAAQTFLDTLDAAGRAKVEFPFDAPQKTRWSDEPAGVFSREGVRMADLTPAQRTAAAALLSAALSRNGYRTVTEIMHGDEQFRAIRAAANAAAARGPARAGGPGGAGRGGAQPVPGTFGENEYYLAFMGAPSTTTPWMLQYGGHHLAINLTIDGPLATMGPSLVGAQPSSYTADGDAVRTLGMAIDTGAALIDGLDDTQRRQATFSTRVADLVLGPGKDGQSVQPEGLLASSMSAAQQVLLLDLVREWTGMMNDAFAEQRMVEIRAGLSQTVFGFSAPPDDGAAYFRIQGPTFVIEFAPQQGDLDHLHTMYRDTTNDYGAMFVRR